MPIQNDTIFASIMAYQNQPIPLGHQGENNSRTIIFSVKRWFNTYGQGSIKLLHKRPGDTIAYNVPIELGTGESEVGNIYWNVTSTDTDKEAGGEKPYGEAELQLLIDDKIVKSDVYRTEVIKSIGDYTETTPSYTPSGGTGADGFSPIAKVTQTEEGAIISITDKNGTTSAEIKNGITPTASVVKIENGYRVSITDSNGPTNADIIVPTAKVGTIENGKRITITDSSGETTADIIVPTAKVEETDDGCTITITDKNGATSTDIFTPTVKITDIDNGRRVTVTDKNGKTTSDIVVPTASVSAIPGGNRLTINDNNGETTVDILNALINGVNTINIKAGDNTEIIQNGTELVISSNDAAANAILKAAQDQHTEEINVLSKYIRAANPTVYNKVSGNPIVVNDGYANASIKSISAGESEANKTITVTRYGVSRDGEDPVNSESVLLDSNGTGTIASLTTTLGENVIYATDGDINIEAEIEYQSNMDYSLYAALQTNIVSENPAVMEGITKNVPFGNIAVDIPLTQSGSGDPYPPGGGKNLLTDVWASTSISSNGVTGTKDGNVFVLSGANTGSGALNWYIKHYSNADSTFTLSPGTYTLSGLHRNGGGYITLGLYNRVNNANAMIAYETGNSVTFTIDEEKTDCFLVVAIAAGASADGVTITPMLESGSSASDYAPYSNIRPIVGFDSVSVTRTGKNLIGDLDYLYKEATYKSFGLTLSANDPESGAVTVNGTNTSSGFIYCSFDLSLTPGDYILSGCPANGRTVGCSQIIRLYENETIVSQASDYGDNTAAFTVSENTSRVELLTLRFAKDTTASNLVFRPMVRPAAVSDATFEPYYQSQSVTVSMGGAGTVYGGNLNLTTGLLTVTHGIVDLGTLSWTRHGTFKNCLVATGMTALADKPPLVSGGNTDCVCSNYKVSAGNGTQDINGSAHYYHICVAPTFWSKTQPIIVINDPAMTNSPQTYAQQLSGVTLAFPLETPKTYQLTLHEIQQLVGTNIMHTDIGNLTIEYRP